MDELTNADTFIEFEFRFRGAIIALKQYVFGQHQHLTWDLGAIEL